MTLFKSVILDNQRLNLAFQSFDLVSKWLIFISEFFLIAQLYFKLFDASIQFDFFCVFRSRHFYQLQFVFHACQPFVKTFNFFPKFLFFSIWGLQTNLMSSFVTHLNRLGLQAYQIYFALFPSFFFLQILSKFFDLAA